MHVWMQMYSRTRSLAVHDKASSSMQWQLMQVPCEGGRPSAKSAKVYTGAGGRIPSSEVVTK